ncbi:peptidoglycan/xylan/chitin deacetylase (PgdA/CDA1 family) [Arthrobacter woluwensis]|uniref:polysaccharide deacetylase family protein n=1 Tax=Arthrobacter woluwensis TaxID=156980 RepID=UPI00277E75B4|nr:polysaccharide deacetylase family protein [Arthrobacter woluwensis]MDQ0707788.1 peptidoglycan/xylan/chitin deacetylase (PgdA/CDA1 family) [Arthrobacter woluwensis]
MPESFISRRAALLALGAATAPLLGACADSPTAAPGAKTGGGQGPSASGGATSSATPTPTQTPSATPTPRKTFVGDFRLPPVQNGLAPVITRVTTKQPVVFLTIDDGVVRTQESLDLLDEYGYPATLFLTKSAIAGNPDFFKKFQARGDRIQNHTISHNTSMVQASYEYQLGEVAGMQDYIKRHYGTTPSLFRPPGGAYSNAMRTAVAAAGLKAVIDWECKANAGRMDYQVGNGLRPGDICLMHFRPEFKRDLAAFHQAQKASGLTVVRLEEFLGI